MKRIILTSLIIFSSSIVAHDLPNTFEAGQPIVASEVNENFAEIEAELNQIKSQLEALASESTNDSPQFLGFTSPTILSELGLQAGREVCPTSFEGSNICKPSDFQNLNDWSFNMAQAALLNFSTWLQYEAGFICILTIPGPRKTISCCLGAFPGLDTII